MTYAVEVYRAGGAAAAPASSDEELGRAAAALRQEGAAVEYLGCISLPGDEMAFYLFDANSREEIEELLRRIGLVAERIVDARATGFASTA